MHPLILAAIFAAAPQNGGQTTRDIVVSVCLPFAETGQASADNIALAGLSPRPGGDSPQDLQTANGHHLVKLTVTGDAGEGTLRRVCEVQARSGGFDQARDAVTGPLQRAGFTSVPDEPEDWPVWERDGITATLHQNPGRATIVSPHGAMKVNGPSAGGTTM